MLNLSIKILNNKPRVVNNIPCVLGEITINNIKEKFDIPLEYWNLKDYKQQWAEGLQRIRNYNRSCLVTCVQDPEKAPLINMWGLYKRNKQVFIYNFMFCGSTYKEYIGDKLFTPETCYNFIPRKPTNPKASVWIVDLNEDN